MPVAISYIDENRGVVLDYSGEVDGDYLIEIITTVFNDDRFKELQYWLADRTNCSGFNIDQSHTRIISNLTKRNVTKNPDLILALVSPKSVEFGMSRMYQIMTDDNGFKTMIFCSRLEAEEWISNEVNSPDK